MIVTRHRLAYVMSLLIASMLTVSCSSHRGSIRGNSTTSPRSHVGAHLSREGLLVPMTYKEACNSEVSICVKTPEGKIPVSLRQPVQFPQIRPGEKCPTTRGRPIKTPDFTGIALGDGPVRVIVDSTPGGAREGHARLLRNTSAPGWLGFKTLWFSMPSYQGPFVIRAKRLDGSGPTAMGEAPRVAPLVIPPGVTMNSGGGYREAPGGTWVKRPGCYGWYVEGLGFKEFIAVQAVLRP